MDNEVTDSLNQLVMAAYERYIETNYNQRDAKIKVINILVDKIMQFIESEDEPSNILLAMSASRPVEYVLNKKVKAYRDNPNLQEKYLEALHCIKN